ncbi:MAG: hypothetical protein J6R68_03530, partial [Clostridia bacterium]|nr:hypothetical protein [Clostridia bacterium]
PLKRIIKNLMCYLIVASMLLACGPSFASDTEPNVKTLFDFKGKSLATCYENAKYYPKLDDTKFSSMYFSNKGTLKTKDIDGETVLAYFDQTAGNDTNSTLSVSTKYEGRFIYTGKIYTNRADSDGNMKFALARFYVNYGSGGVEDGSIIVTDEINKLKANEWYEFRYEINLYKTKNNFSVSFAPVTPQSSSDTGFSKIGTLKTEVFGKLGFRGGRFDFDLDSKNTENFVAYKDLKLTHTQNPGKIDTYLNGNLISNGFKDGIYTAVGSGSGLFALGVYEDNELIYLDISNSQEELETRKLNAVIENGQNKTVKIFRFDEDNAPYCVKAEPLYDSSEETRIYANYDFSKEGEFAISDYTFLSDGQLYIDNSTGKKPRFPVTALNPSRYIVFEADYSIPKTQEKCHRVRLIGGYYNSTTTGNASEPDTFVLTNKHGELYSYRDRSVRNPFGTLTSTPTNVAILIDNLEGKYDIYIDKKLKRSGDSLYTPTIDQDTKLNKRSFFIGHASGDNDDFNKGTLIVDNLKIYDVSEEDVKEGNIFKDIGNKIPNVHVTDYSKIT